MIRLLGSSSLHVNNPFDPPLQYEAVSRSYHFCQKGLLNCRREKSHDNGFISGFLYWNAATEIYVVLYLSDQLGEDSGNEAVITVTGLCHSHLSLSYVYTSELYC